MAERVGVRHGIKVRLGAGPLTAGTIAAVGLLVFRCGGRVASVKFERRFVTLDLRSPVAEAEEFAGVIKLEVLRLHREASEAAKAVGRG